MRAHDMTLPGDDFPVLFEKAVQYFSETKKIGLPPPHLQYLTHF